MGDVTPIGGKRGGDRAPPDDERWLRKRALDLAQQLPDETTDALRIISYLEWLVLKFLEMPNPPS